LLPQLLLLLLLLTSHCPPGRAATLVPTCRENSKPWWCVLRC